MESVKKTNYILTFLHVFVFVVPVAGEFLADEAFLTPSTHTHTHSSPALICCHYSVILTKCIYHYEKMKMSVCTFFLTPLE